MNKAAASARLAGYQPNPEYGTGIFRRRIAFVASDGAMTVTLFDCFHQMAMRLEHDGKVITSVAANMLRFPKDTCPGAIAVLRDVEGVEVAGGRNSVAGKFPRGAHCTHLLDMAMWGVSALARGIDDQCFEISLSDMDHKGFQSLLVQVDGNCALEWTLENEFLIEPAEYRGRRLFGGFSKWADSQFSGFERDLWHMAQMAVFVSHGRLFVVDGRDRRAARSEPSRKGSCYSYSDPAFQTARDNTGYVFDLTEGLPRRDRKWEMDGGMAT